MKTQLLQDLEESGAGAAPRQAPARAPRPQVWRRPQAPALPAARTQAGVRQSAARPSVAPLTSAQPSTVPRSAASPLSAPSPAAPSPTAPSSTAPRPPAPAAASPEAPDGAAIPGWLAERLRDDAERDARAQWRATWQRRAVAWSLGILGLALAVAGGLWMVEQNRVDGALVVVAKTTPEAREAPAAPVPVPVAPLPEPVAPPAAPALADVEGAPVKPEQAAAPVEPIAIEPVESVEPVEPVEQAPPPAVAAVAPPKAQIRPARRKPPEARPVPARRAVVARAPAPPSARQRREETLLQCRAHGYSERQCVRRACEMTRYGFACKG